MDMHKCKLCFRKFMSGKALGGHMARSHFTKLPLPKKVFQEKKEESINEKLFESSSTESSFKSEEKGIEGGLVPHPRRSLKVDKQNGTETDTETDESEKIIKSTRRRSNRVKKRTMEDDEIEIKNESFESITELSYVASNEDVALFLLMLSRGELKVGGRQQQQRQQHKCDICKKVFKSSQALGGHRVSHKKLSIKKSLKQNGKKRSLLDENKVHECPHCGRIFGSGQALGGHKRSHSLSSPTRITTTITAASCSSNVGESLVSSEKFHDGLIDLNFPAPMDDDYDDGFSHQQVSPIYEAV